MAPSRCAALGRVLAPWPPCPPVRQKHVSLPSGACAIKKWNYSARALFHVILENLVYYALQKKRKWQIPDICRVKRGLDCNIGCTVGSTGRQGQCARDEVLDEHRLEEESRAHVVVVARVDGRARGRHRTHLTQRVDVALRHGGVHVLPP